MYRREYIECKSAAGGELVVEVFAGHLDFGVYRGLSVGEGEVTEFHRYDHGPEPIRKESDRGEEKDHSEKQAPHSKKFRCKRPVTSRLPTFKRVLKPKPAI